MHPQLLAIVASRGLVTRIQALDLGTSPGDIRAMLRRGEWVLLRRGIYTTAEHWRSLDEYVGQPRLRAIAAGMAARRGWVLSHDSACHVLGMPVLRREAQLVHLTRPGWTNAWTENGVKHHLAAFEQHQVLEVDGVRTLDAARTAVDVAREHGIRAGIVACDAALRRGHSHDDLRAAYARMRNWPGVRAARAAVDLADRGAETALESLTRELVIESGIGPPETQFPVRTVRGVFWCDLRVGNHVIEADGFGKYRPVEAGGLATDPERSLRDEKLRERAIADRGLVVTRVIWADLRGARRTEAIARLTRDHRESVTRFGSRLAAELREEAEEIRQRHGDRRSA